MSPGTEGVRTSHSHHRQWVAVCARAIRCLFAGVAFLLFTAASPQVVKGRCIGCKGPGYNLREIHFVSRNEGWANAAQWWEGNGSGYANFLHTTDGGVHWHRVPFVWQVGAESPPPFAFIDRNRGWIEWNTPDDGVYHWSTTTDGGRTWRHRDMNRDVEGMRAFQFFDAQHGYGAGERRFLRTDDGGATWKGTELPVSFIDGMSFADRQRGFVVGGTVVENGHTPWDGSTRILVTTDGGTTWRVAQLEQRPYGEAIKVGWIDSMTAFIVTWGADDSGSELLMTTDGGESWKAHQDRTFQGTNKYINEVAIAPDGRGYLFFSDQKTNFIGTTTDRGRTWKTKPFPYGISDCQLFETQFWCSSGLNIVKLDLP